MNTRNKVILLSVFFGLLVWAIDATVDYYVFYEGSFIDLFILNVPQHEVYIRLVILITFIVFGLILSKTISRLHIANKQNQKLVNELKIAMADIKKLSGFLPICASCKKIRDDNGYWNQIESYIRDHSEAQFSHGICPECAEKLYPEFIKKNDNLKATT